ncbi:MAG: hypothetical protein O2954_03380 [bacterium]|nr:hypothetical protein [bacterium]
MALWSQFNTEDKLPNPTLARMFATPPDEFRPVPWLCYTGRCSESEVYRSVDTMYEQGLRSFFIFPVFGMEIEYLSEAWFHIVEKTLAYCRKKGMTVWIYDDYDWPNGSCAGKLTDLHPEYAIHAIEATISGPIAPGGTAEVVIQREFWKAWRVNGASMVEEPNVDIRSADDKTTVRWTNDAETEQSILVLSQGHAHQKWVSNSGVLWRKDLKGNGYTDLLREDASRLFMEMTHEAYFERMKQYFGTTLCGFFHDEPRVSGLHYNQEIAGEFAKRYGDSLENCFPHILVSNSPKRFKIRGTYWQLVGEKLGEHLRRINNWCAECGVDFTGHLLGEESPEQEIEGQGGVWPVRRHMSIPGSDLLEGQSNYGVAPAYREDEDPYRGRHYSPAGLILAIRLAAATARFNNTARVMCEAYGALPFNVAPEDHMIQAHWLTALGINLINDNTLRLSFDSFRKRAIGSKHFTTPWWKHYRDFAESAGRSSLMATVGRIPARIGLLHPALTAQVLKCERGKRFGINDLDCRMLTQTNRICQNAAEALTRGRWDWEIVFEEIWQDALLRDSHAHVGDLELATLVVPAAHALSLDVFEKLKDFAVAGGQVIFLGALPSISIDEGFDVQARTLEILTLPNVTHIETDRDDSWELIMESLDCVLNESPAARLTGVGAEEVLLVRRRSGDRDLFHIVNMGEREANVRAELRTHKPLTLWSPDDGQVYSVANASVSDSALRLRLSPGEGFILLASDEPCPVTGEYHFGFDIGVSPFHSPPTLAYSTVWQQRSLGRVEWDVIREDPNIARLTPVIRLDPQNVGVDERWQDGTPDETWTGLERGRLPFLLNPAESKFVWYKCMFRTEHRPEDLAVVLDNSDFFEVYLNGERICKPDPYTLWDYANTRFAISDRAAPGLNILAVKTKINDHYHPDVGMARKFGADCLEPIALIGDFYDDTDDDGIPLLRTPRTRITQGGWAAFGMKSYIGSLTYRRKVRFESVNNDIWLDLGNIRCVAELRINGQEIGRRSWGPYRFRIDQVLSAGENLLEISVTNSMANLLESVDRPSCRGSSEWEPKAGLYGPIRIYSR